jgi:rpsC_bact: ribosomal protein S3
MGQKVSPHGLRVGVIKDWNSKWYGDKKNFADFLAEDNQIREYVKKNYMWPEFLRFLLKDPPRQS